MLGDHVRSPEPSTTRTQLCTYRCPSACWMRNPPYHARDRRPQRTVIDLDEDSRLRRSVDHVEVGPDPRLDEVVEVPVDTAPVDTTASVTGERVERRLEQRQQLQVTLMARHIRGGLPRIVAHRAPGTRATRSCAAEPAPCHAA